MPNCDVGDKENKGIEKDSGSFCPEYLGGSDVTVNIGRQKKQSEEIWLGHVAFDRPAR